MLGENGDEAQRVEVFRSYSEGASRRNIATIILKSTPSIVIKG